MHKSQLGGFIIDCQTDDLVQAAEFWSAALGLPVLADPSPEESKYRRLETGADELVIEVQQVEHNSRFQLMLHSRTGNQNPNGGSSKERWQITWFFSDCRSCPARY